MERCDQTPTLKSEILMLVSKPQKLCQVLLKSMYSVRHVFKNLLQVGRWAS